MSAQKIPGEKCVGVTGASLQESVADQGGPNRPRPPPLLSDDFNFFGRFFFFCLPPRRSSGRRTVPLPNNVNVGPKNSGEKYVGVPPPLSDFFRPGGEFRFPAPPFHKSWIRHWELIIKIIGQYSCMATKWQLRLYWVKQNLPSILFFLAAVSASFQIVITYPSGRLKIPCPTLPPPPPPPPPHTHWVSFAALAWKNILILTRNHSPHPRRKIIPVSLWQNCATPSFLRLLKEEVFLTFLQIGWMEMILEA